jgi:hypothetical protein
VADALLEMPALGVNTVNTFEGMRFRALLQAIADDPEGGDTDLTLAARAFERHWRGRLSRIGSIHAGVIPEAQAEARLRLFEEVMGRTQDPEFALEVLKAWTGDQKGNPRASERLLEWANELQGRELAEYAAMSAGRLASEKTLTDVLDAHATLPWKAARELISGLRRNPNLVTFEWSENRLWPLIDLLGDTSERVDYRHLWDVFKILLASRDIAEEVVRMMIDTPLRAAKREIPAVLRNYDCTWSESMVRNRVTSSWQEYTGEERLLVLEHLDDLWGDLEEGDAFDKFLRARLQELAAERHDDPEEAAMNRSLKKMLLRELPTVDMDDLRAAFDLSTPEGALAACQARHLEYTEEYWDLLAAALKAEDENLRVEYLYTWAEEAPTELCRRAARALMAEEDLRARKSGLLTLAKFRHPDDVSFLAKALADPEHQVRLVAADALAHNYDKDAIRALVKALDDPVAQVRDKVLETLEAIKDIESKKDYWRKFAENTR